MNPLPQTPSKDSHVFILIGLFIFILLILFAGYYEYQFRYGELYQTHTTIAHPTPTPQAYKTYLNKTYNFSFQYPTAFSRSGTDEAVYLGNDARVDGVNHAISVGVQNYDSMQARKLLNFSEAGMTIKAEDVTEELINGKQVTKAVLNYSIPTDLQSKKLTYRTEKKYRILISLENNTIVIESTLETKPIAEQVLSTFKFLNQEATISPTCIPRPACLDAEPRCMIPETLDMCKKATPTLM